MNVESGVAQSQHLRGETSEQARAAEQLDGGGLTANAALLSNLARLDSKQKPGAGKVRQREVNRG